MKDTRRAATKSQRRIVLLMQDCKCAICGAELDDDYQVDHLIKHSKEGATELWNLQALCLHCHSAKTSAEARRSS